MTFDDLIEIIIKHEGGYVHDLKDPGGETKYGISKRAYPEIDIKMLTVEGAKEIYRHDYWAKIRGTSLNSSLALMVLDSAVNLGVFRASKILQKVLKVKEDGIIGNKTVKAIYDFDEEEVLGKYAMERLKFYQSIGNWERYGKGWSRRLLDISLRAVMLIKS